MAKRRAHLLISGLVQGVYFRASLRREATLRDVSGWVRNLPDGAVEAVLEGEEEDVRRVIDWSRHGPPHAAVDDVTAEWGDYRGEYNDFATR